MAKEKSRAYRVLITLLTVLLLIGLAVLTYAYITGKSPLAPQTQIRLIARASMQMTL